MSAVLLALLTQRSYAQSLPESPRQKAAEARKKADEKANDEAYKALVKPTPDANKKVDPWGGLRPSSQTPAKQIDHREGQPGFCPRDTCCILHRAATWSASGKPSLIAPITSRMSK